MRNRNNVVNGHKVVHVTSVHPPFDVRILYKECQCLREEGYDVVLVAPHDHDLEENGVKIRAVPKSRTRFARMTLTAYRVFKAALKEKCDVIHMHDPELLPYAQLVRLFFRKRIIFDMHENVPKAILTKSWINPWFRPLIYSAYRLLERILLFRVPVVYAEMSYANDYPWIKTSMVVLNMPILDEFVRVSEPKHNTPAVGYIGLVTPERGSLITLKALAILKERGHNIDWICVGQVEEKHKANLQHLSEQIGLSGVKFLGYRVPRDGLQMIARCHIGLAVLNPIPNYVDSYPTKMFEYMAFGLPVVASNFPLYREVIEENQCGICVEPLEPAKVAAAIQWLLEHPDEAQAMGCRGKLAVQQKYRWEHEAEKLSSFYREKLGF